MKKLQIKAYLQFSLVLFLGLTLAGCAKYRAEPIRRLIDFSSSKTDNSVQFSYKIFTKEDCRMFLGRKLLRAGYQPIHLTILNNSDRSFNFSKARFSLPTVSSIQVARRVHTSTVARAASYGALGVFLMPLFLIPAVVDGVKSSNANKSLDDDFIKKELDDQQIAPFSMINGLVFIPIKDFSFDFRINLLDSKSGKLVELCPKKQVVELS